MQRVNSSLPKPKSLRSATEERDASWRVRGGWVQNEPARRHPLKNLKLALCSHIRIYYARSMDFEWDEAKNQQNIAKDGIDFQDAQRIFERPFLIRPDVRREYVEERWVGLARYCCCPGLYYAKRKNTYHLSKKG